MKIFVKNYIGKGKKVEGLEIIKINLKIADLVKFAHKYNDEDYISLEVAKLQTPDNFGHDYTVYVNRLEEEQVKEVKEPAPGPAPKKQTKKSKASKQEATVEVPF
jgi:phage protein D